MLASLNLSQTSFVTGTDNYTKYLVDSLKQYVQLRGRNISMDRYFTSLPVAEYLLENDITVVGTLKCHRIGLPKELTEVKDRDDLSVKYAFTEDGNIMLVSYVVKKKSGKRNILMLTTMHKSVKITRDSRKKPNNTKRSHTQLDSRKQVIAFQDRVMTINIKEAQHPLKREKQVIDKSSIMLKM